MTGYRSMVSVVAVAVGVLVSVGTVMATGNGPLMVAWAGVWSVAAGMGGWRRESWNWPVELLLAMLGSIMVWEIVAGRTSWASLYVFMLGSVYIVAAAGGGSIGTWLGKRRATMAGSNPSQPPDRARTPQ